MHGRAPIRQPAFSARYAACSIASGCMKLDTQGLQLVVEPDAPTTLDDLNLSPRGPVHPSPADWADFLLPDRFSDGKEDGRLLFDRARPDAHRYADHRKWMRSGCCFQGGTLKGVHGKLDYLRQLGVTTLWIGPIWKQRADLQTYHGYGIQNFLDVDPRFGTRPD